MKRDTCLFGGPVRNYKKLIPIIALILVGLGVNLDEFGIDLKALSGQGSDRAGVDTRQAPASDASPSPRATGTASRSADALVDSGADLPHWSATQPELNLWHIFEGEINRKGKPTGFHSRPGGRDPGNARVVSIKDPPNGVGVYTAQVEVRDGGQWKSKFSSFFPDNLSRQEIIDVVLHAYRNSKNPNRQPWSGPSGLGFQVQGYTSSRGGINTAFPIYNSRQ